VPGTPFLDDVSAEIRALVERCLSKEPSQRPTAPELLAELADTDVSAAWLPEPVIGEIPREGGRGFRPLGIEAVSPQDVRPATGSGLNRIMASRRPPAR
jgi:serine/threonine protein kinase